MQQPHERTGLLSSNESDDTANNDAKPTSSPSYGLVADNGDAAALSSDGKTDLSALPLKKQASNRILSLDQFRGYVVLLLIAVPAVGFGNDSPAFFRHNGSGFSLADSIMPHFYIMVGFAMRLTLTRLAKREGVMAAIKKQLVRSGRLFAIGLVYYGVDGFASYSGTNGFQSSWWTVILQILYGRSVWQTLTTMALCQILLLPVIVRPVSWRAAYALLLLVIYIACEFSFWFEYTTPWGNYIDGGVVGCLVWSVAVLAGSFLNDFSEWAAPRISHVHVQNKASMAKRILLLCLPLVVAAVVTMSFGIGLSALPQSWSPVCLDFANGRASVPCPSDAGVVSLPFSQYNPIVSVFSFSMPKSTFTYQIFGIGWSIVVYLVFFIASDIFGLTWSFFNVLSATALQMYIFNDYGFGFTDGIIPSDSPAWCALLFLPISLLININIAYFLFNNKWFIHL